MSRQHTMMGILLVCLGNGFVSPFVLIAYMWAPFWFPDSFIPMKQEYHMIGSTMVVRYDGRVGIGVASPAERLDVNGKVKAAGFLAGWTRKITGCPNTTTCPATCDAGYVMGGGCETSAANTLLNSYPDTDTSWKCVYTASVLTVTAYAICANIE